MTDMALARATRKDVRQAEQALQMRLDKARRPGGWAVLGSMPDGGIEAMAFVVLMQASKSAQEDLKGVMAAVKAVNGAKAKQRELLGTRQRQAAEPDALDPDAFVVALATLQAEAMLAETAAELDSLSGSGELQQMRLQIIMDRRAKMMGALSNIMKKIADTQTSILGNLK